MKDRTKAANSYARRTRLLIACGLIRGITPTSIRKVLGAAIPDFVSSLPDGYECAMRTGDRQGLRVVN
jgi:hypothetical protein